MYLCAKLPQSCLTLCNPMDCSPPGSSVHGILQARILERVAMPSSRGSSRPRDWSSSLMSPALAGGFFTSSATWEEKEMATYSSILAWRIPGTEEPGGLLSMGLHRVGHDWSDLAAAATWESHPVCLWHRDLCPFPFTRREEDKDKKGRRMYPFNIIPWELESSNLDSAH